MNNHLRQLQARDPREGLDAPMRTCLCDAYYGPIACIDGLWQRQTMSPVFRHGEATVAKLVELRLLKLTGDEVAACTLRGRYLANRLRARRQAIAAWEAAERQRAGVRAAADLRRSYPAPVGRLSGAAR